MAFKSPHSELYGKSYGYFSKIAQDRPELRIVVIKPYFENCVVVVGFCTVNKSVVRLLDLFILGFYKSIGCRVEVTNSLRWTLNR